MKNSKKILAGVVLLAVTLIVVYLVNRDRPRFTITDSTGTEYETARVLSIEEDNSVVDDSTENVKKGSQDLKLELLTGRYKGDICFVTNYFSALYNVDVKKGDSVCVRIDTTDVGLYQVSIYNYNRIPLIIGLIILFALTLIGIGGKQGAKAFLGLLYTVVCIFFILVPLVLKGGNSTLITCVITILTSAVCFLLIGGVQKKTVSAAIGCACGVLLAAMLGALASMLGGVSTFQMDEAEALLLVRSTFGLKLRGLFISGIVIAAMGAVMDIAMSIASALEEVHRLNPERTWKQLFASGMKIGRDAMGTMANTLVLAYVGSSLNMIILIYSYGVSLTQLLNTDFVAIEMIRAIAGSIGIICTVPCVSIVSAILFSRKDEGKQK